jgi:HEAT repeat protein
LLLRALARDAGMLGEAQAALTSPLANRRAAGACALSWLGSIAVDAAPAVRRALAQERDPEAARRLLETATNMRVRVSRGVLSRHLANAETEPEALLLAAATADAGAQPRALRVVFRRALSSSRSARTRAAAALALGVLADTDALPALQAALDDDSARVRLAAARALGVLGRLGSKDVAQILAEHARVEMDGSARSAMLEESPQTMQGAPLPESMREVLEVRVVGQEAAETQPLVDVLLQDGRWRRFRPLAGGELLVADLPQADAEVRAVD